MLDSAKNLEKAIPHARQLTLEGQSHNVDLKILAPVLVDFFLQNGKSEKRVLEHSEER
jgi:hypothetical protein